MNLSLSNPLSKSIALFSLLGIVSIAACQKLPPDNSNRINQLRSLKVAPVVAAHQTIKAWLMDNESKRQEGMMFLKPGDVKENQGMLFLFTTLQGKDSSFWMHNCPAGLDIIYIGANHKVITIGDGKPENDTPVPTDGAYNYVLELVRGWSKRHGLKKGDVITISAGLKAKG